MYFLHKCGYYLFSGRLAARGGKRMLLLAASILAARKLGEIDARSPLMDNAIADAITLVERIMVKIDSRSAASPDQRMTSGAGYLWRSKT